WEAANLGGDDDADVIDITELRLRRLPEPTRTLLATAACAGRPLELPLLGAVAGIPASELDAALQPAAREQLVRLHGGTLALAHDNVRAAAELLVDAGARPQLHRRIAEAILAATPAD